MASGTIKAKTAIHASINDTNRQATGSVGGSGGTYDHARLTNRDKENQHPISAISGLETVLGNKLDTSTALPLIEDATKNKAAGLYFDARKELATKSYWYLTSKVDPITGMGTRDSIISGPYDLGMGGGTGGATGGITNVTLSKTDPETGESLWPSAIAVGSNCEVGINWSSTREGESTGSGTIYFYVNGELVSKKSYKQGIVKFDATDKITAGDNKIEIKVIDAYSTTKNIIGNITGVTLKLESTFDASIAYTDTIIYTYKAYGDIAKTMHFILDDKEIDTTVVKSSGETTNYIISNLTHGSHKFNVYFTADLGGEEVSSNVLKYDLIYYVAGNDTPIIASVFPEESEQEQYVALNIKYRVFTPNKNTSEVKVSVNGVQLGEILTVDQALQTWVYRPMDIGNYILTITTGNIEKVFNIHAVKSRVDVEVATTSLLLALDAEGRSNAEPLESRLKWEDTKNSISCNLTGFNWSSNGWMTDTKGNPVLRVAGSARVEIPYKPFLKDFTQTGKTIEFEIATSDVKAYDSMIIQCLDGDDTISRNVWLAGEDDRTKRFKLESLDEAKFLEAINHEYNSFIFTYNNGAWHLDNETISESDLLDVYGIKLGQIDLDTSDLNDVYYIDGDRLALEYKRVGMGFYVTPQLAKLQAQQTSLSTQYKENDNVRLTFVIENKQENRLVYMYVNGIMSGVTIYPTSESFRQPTAQNIYIGSNDATVDIYNLRIYDTALSRKQVVNNWIADTQDIALRADRYYNNDNYDDTGNIVIDKLPGTTPYMVLTAEKLPSYKKDKKSVDVQFVYPSDSTRDFTSVGASADVQGTSSQYYWKKNFKIKFGNGFIDNEGNVSTHYKIQGPSSKKEKTFTFKADVASSEGTNNVELVRYFEDTKNWYSPAELAQDPDDTLDGYETKDRVRVGIDGFPMVMFHNDGTTTKFYGKMNFNNDKGNDRTFGFKDGDECWEITNNSNKLVLFQDADMSNWTSAFESRYPETVTNAQGIEHDYGTASGELDKLSKVINWIVSTCRLETDTEEQKAAKLQKFKDELSTYFDKTSALFYYLYTELFLMVDSRAKNAMLAYYASRTLGDGGNKWFWIPYDMDTALGINNEGLLVFDYDAEDTDLVHGANVYNGQQSTFWNNIRDAFKAELTKMYADLRASVWSFESIEKKYEDHQAVWSESIFNEDTYSKYLEPLILNSDATYLGMAQGSKAEQRRWWLANRFKYLDSKYRTGDAADQHIMLRVYNRDTLHITPYINCFVTAIYDQAENYVTVDAEKNKEVEVLAPTGWNPGKSDAVLSIYSADMLKDIGDISGFKPGYANFSAATKLQKLKVGSTEAGYSNEKLTGINVGNNHLLTEIDARNCTNLGAGTGAEVTPTIDLSSCVSIEKVFFDNTQILGCQFPVGGYLKEVHLPATITNLEIRNHPSLETLVLQGTDNLQSIWLENISSSAIDAYNIISQMKAGSSVRLIGIDIELAETENVYEFYRKLDEMVGKDLHGAFTDKAQVTGRITVDRMSYSDYIILKEWYPEVNLNVKKIICTVDFANEDETQIYSTQFIVLGNAAKRPSNPTKSSTQANYYTFTSWDTDYTNIQADTTIHAIFEEHVQEYEVTFKTASDVIKLASLTNPEGETTAVYNVFYNTLATRPDIILESIPESVTPDSGIAYPNAGWDDCWYTEDGRKFDFEQDVILDNITLIARWIDSSIPSVSVQRVAFNKFKYHGTDNLGITAWAVTRTDSIPNEDEWTTIEATTNLNGEYIISDSGYYYMYVRDGQNNINSTKIFAEKIQYILAEGVETTHLIENGNTIGQFALSGTTASLEANLDSHYENKSITVNDIIYSSNDTILINKAQVINVSCTKKYYKALFNMCGWGEQVPEQVIAYKDYIDEPDLQFDQGYAILNWYKDPEFTTIYNFKTDYVSENTTIYARWEEYSEPSIFTLNITEDNTEVTVCYWQSRDAITKLTWGDGSITEKGVIKPDGYVLAKHTYSVGEYLLKVQLYSGEYLMGRNYDIPMIFPRDVLTNIDFAWDVQTTNQYAFRAMTNLTSARLTSYMTTIALGTFQDCPKLTITEIPKNITTIGAYAFKDCQMLNIPINIGKKLKIVDGYAFDGCINIPAVTIENINCNFGEYIFNRCTSIKEVPSNLVNFSLGMFSGCTSLQNIVLSENVASLAGGVFRNCSSLSSVIIKNKNISFGEGLNFDNCPLLTTAGPIGSDSSIEFAFTETIPAFTFSYNSGNSHLENIIIPDTITTIGENAFLRCSRITKIDIPEGLEELGDNAFAGCSSLNSFYLPWGLKSIGYTILFGCTGLTNIYINTTSSNKKIDIVNQSWFLGTYSFTHLHIPSIIDTAEKAMEAYGSCWNFCGEGAELSYVNDIN